MMAGGEVLFRTFRNYIKVEGQRVIIMDAAVSSAVLSPLVSRIISMAKGSVVPGPSEVMRAGAFTTFSSTYSPPYSLISSPRPG